MAGRNADSVIIVRRKKVIVGGGHHGGAWKVAYADFVTAMMAFFLLMWLISVSDEKTKLGLADYFSPSIPVHSTVGGGDGPFFGMSMFSTDLMAQDGVGQTGDVESRSDDAGDASLSDVQNALIGASGDAVEADPLLKHIRTRLTDEGLIIEVFDVEGSPLFGERSSEPNQILLRLLDMIGRVLARTENLVAITGHLAQGDAGGGVDPWLLSSDRAQQARELLVAAGVRDGRLDRVTGRADRNPSTEAPADLRNRRVEITLLRQFTPQQ